MRRQSTSNFIIHSAIFVKGMKFNFLSVSQLFDIGYKIKFYSIKCLIKHDVVDTTILVGQRKIIFVQLIFLLFLTPNKCLMLKEEFFFYGIGGLNIPT